MTLPMSGIDAAGFIEHSRKSRQMTSPSPTDVETTTLWQGGLSTPVGPPALPDFGSGTITIVSQQSTAKSGSLVSYAGGIFTRQFWSAGPAVPFFIEVLSREQVSQIRDQVAEQLRGPGSELDDIPLRAFVEAVRLYVEQKESDRFALAIFGSIAQLNPGELLGEVSWASGTIGSVQGSAQGVSAQTHLVSVPTGNLTPLREADLRSLVSALGTALATQNIDPLWQQMLSLAEQALP